MSRAEATFALIFVAACTQSGTIDVTLVTGPGSTMLDDVQTLELTLTDPLTTQTATRQGSGFSIEIEVDANDAAGQLIVEGLDGSGTLIAAGESPPFPVDALDAAIADLHGGAELDGRVAGRDRSAGRSARGRRAVVRCAVRRRSRCDDGADRRGVDLQRVRSHERARRRRCPRRAPASRWASRVARSRICSAARTRPAPRRPTIGTSTRRSRRPATTPISARSRASSAPARPCCRSTPTTSC